MNIVGREEPKDHRWEEEMISGTSSVNPLERKEHQFPNHNELIYKFVMNMLKDQRSISVTYDTDGPGLDDEDEYITDLHIRTSKRNIKARY